MTQTKMSLGQAIDQITGALEGLDPDARRTAVEAACAHLKVTLAQILPETAAGQQPRQGNDEMRDAGRAASRVADAAPAPPPSDIRTLKADKKPGSAREMACVVAFYLQELAPQNERKESVSSADLEKYFKHANFKLPERMTQVLPDAKSAGYFDSPARGAYKLNAVGYNLVAHKLPAKPVAD